MMIKELAKVVAGRHSRQRLQPSLLHLLGGTGRRSVQAEPVVTPLPLHWRSRCFSSHLEDSSFLCSYKARQLLENIDASIKDFIPCAGRTQVLESLISQAEKATEVNFSLQKMKDVYYETIRPELVSKFLIHTHELDDVCTQWLHYQTHSRMKRRPRYISCYDLMKELFAMNEDKWVFFLDYLSRERIAVIEVWRSISQTEHLHYNYGLKDFKGFHFHKGEADASFHEKSKTADLAILIWDDFELINATTYTGVGNCKNIAESEAKAAFAVLQKAKEMGIKNFVLWTDNHAVCGVLSGSKHVDPDNKLFMALRSMRKSFERLIVVCVPREMLHIADSLLRKPSYKDPQYMEESSRNWDLHLSGSPIFKVSLNKAATAIVNSFGQPVNGDPPDDRFYVNVKSDRRIGALCNVMQALNPRKLYVAVKDVEMKPESMKKDLFHLLGNSVVMHKMEDWSIYCSVPSTNSNSEDSSRVALVAFDGPCPKIPFAISFTIVLSSDNDTELLSSLGMKEPRASDFIHFHGVCPPRNAPK
ncbi:hypothetical protein ACP70R_032434 [Stipagrostis hirtigluma subsp. patula]